MGVISWKTADTNETILSDRPVYLLQPGGRPPIKEEAYDGYAVFGGVNAFCWLCNENFPDIPLEAFREETAKRLNIDKDRVSDEQLKSNIGVSIDCGYIYKDVLTQLWWSVFGMLPEGLVDRHHSHSYETPIPEIGKTPNQLVREGRFIKMPIRNLTRIKYSLKFSFDPDAVYEELPASEQYSAHGYL